MKKRNVLAFFLLSFIMVTSLVLVGCGKVINYEDNLDEYVYTMKFHENFNVVQLTDIHWNVNTSSTNSKTYLDKMFEEVDRKLKESNGKIDLIEITGDSLMLDNKYHVKTFLKYMESVAQKYDTYYAIIWGNHDGQGLYSYRWLSNKCKNASRCIYLEPNDDLYGRSNFIINLVDDASNVKWQIVNLDSGESYTEGAAHFFKDYDYIRDDQVDWMKKENARAGNDVPTLVYYHIPQTTFPAIWEEVVNGATYYNNYFKLEGFAEGAKDSKLLDAMKELNVKACFMGHAHNNDWTVDYQGITIGFGVKTGVELYYAHVLTDSDDGQMQAGLAKTGITENFDLIGASVVTIKEDGTFDLTHLYYNEREDADFAKWVAYK